MLKDEAKEMFKKYWALEKHLEEQKDTKGLELMIETIKGSSIVITSLIEYNNIMFKYCEAITKEVEQ